MATTTTNFGWDIPQSTDLVKDGATAIAALGQDIDTAFIDLKGGTTGQVLSKASGTDLDYTWVDANPGDITGVTAGTGISGGGTSGTVTITNSMATAIDAKGDLIAGTGADAFSRLAVGTNGQVLTADSAEATGLKWVTAASGSTFVGCKATQNSAWSIANGTNNVFAFPNEEFDTDGFHSTTTNNGRLTIPTGKGGYYSFTFTIGQETTGGQIEFYFRKNGSTLTRFDSNDSKSASHCFTTLLNVAAGDYFDVSVYNATGGTITQVGETAFSCFLIGA